MTANLSNMDSPGDMSLDAIVGETVHILMRRQGMTQARLAELVGVHQAALSHKLRGNRPWRLEDMQRAATALGVDVAALVAGLPRLDSNQQPSGYLYLLVSEPIEFPMPAVCPRCEWRHRRDEPCPSDEIFGIDAPLADVLPLRKAS